MKMQGSDSSKAPADKWEVIPHICQGHCSSQSSSTGVRSSVAPEVLPARFLAL